MIRAYQDKDLDNVMELWLRTNISAHSFIESEYWQSNFEFVKTVMPEAAIYLYEENDEILGFIGLVDNYIAGIFVAEKAQRKGIGKMLLDCAKSRREKLSLQVYQKNEKAVKFYLREGFVILSQQVDENTGEIELEMSYKEAESMLVMCYPKCSTCKKALNWLDEQNIEYTKRNIAEENPTYEELKEWHEKSGLPLKRFFNISGMVYRDLELKDKLPAMSEDEQLKLLATNGMLVKRPLVIDGGKVLVGFRKKEWAEVFENNLTN